MKKIFKFIFALCMSIIIGVILSPQIFATSEQNIQDQEYKIMKYDVKTGKKTEVDMDEIERVLKESMITKGSSVLPNTTPSYEPDQKLIQRIENINDAISSSIFVNLTSFLDVNVDPVGSMLHNRKNCRVTYEGTFEGKYGTFAASAVLVGDNLALTASHCIMDSDGNFHPN